MAEITHCSDNSRLVKLVRCPHCHARLDGDLRCQSCGSIVAQNLDVIDLLPRGLSGIKKNEDKEFSDANPLTRAIAARPWRTILARHQVLQVIRFDREIMPQFHKGAFLEIGGGTCFAASIYKSTFPSELVIASDVSRNTLQRVAVPTSRMFPYPPDYFAALDAEDLPFHDESLDGAFAMSMMHHLPRPDLMLREIQRVLRPGGVFIALDHCVPTHFAWLFRREARNRTETHGIQEDLLPLGRWRAIIRDSGLPSASLRPYLNSDYQPNPVFAVSGRFIRLLPTWMAARLFPVGMMIVYEKPG
ncbi:MAG: class I SAM-dependent methyltransferase [Chloroflexota bacterium]|nr:MAG: class I SAM-dependent methyltransferase [Chloroflexota bacterium]